MTLSAALTIQRQMVKIISEEEIRKEVERTGGGLTGDTAFERKELRKTMKTC